LTDENDSDEILTKPQQERFAELKGKTIGSVAAPPEARQVRTADAQNTDTSITSLGRLD
jgi:hypothetical protein